MVESGAYYNQLPPEQYNQGYYPQAGYQQPGYQQPGYQQPGYQQPGYQQPGYPQPGSYPGQYNAPGQPFNAYYRHTGNLAVFYRKHGKPKISVGPGYLLALVWFIGELVAIGMISLLIRKEYRGHFSTHGLCNWLGLLAVVSMTVFHLILSCYDAGYLRSLKPAKAYEHMHDIRLCKICNAIGKERTIHCQRCNICVKRSLGHSFFFGRCIGTKLGWYLLGFFVSLIASIVYAVYLITEKLLD